MSRVLPLQGHREGLKQGLSILLPPTYCAGLRYRPAMQSHLRRRMRQVTPSLKGGETHNSQVVALCEQSCCWEEILGDPSEPEREFSVSSHSLGFAFSPGLFLPVQLS